MPKTITLETDPAEIAGLIKTDKGVKDAIGALLKGASITIPPHEIEALEKRIVKAVGATTPKSGGPVSATDVATKLLELMEERGKKASTPSAKSAAVVTKAITSSRAAAVAAGAGASDEVMAFLYENCSPGLPLRSGKQNVRLCGPAGASKTWRARQFGDGAGFDHVLEVQCLSDMEPRDFIAGPVPGEQQNGFRAPFVDGPLAKAWRLAAKGEKVCIILDEVGNVPKAAKQAFQTCLSPFGAYGDEKTKLVTGRAIEATCPKGGRLLNKTEPDYFEPYIEEIVAPFANITIIGTQNVGAEYGCTEDSPAIKARLMAKYVATDKKLITSACGAHMKQMGWTKSKTAVNRVFTKLWQATLDAKQKSLLEREISLREIIHALDKCSHVADDIDKIIPTLKRTLLGAGFNEWFVGNGHDGCPMKEQMDSWADIVNKYITK